MKISKLLSLFLICLTLSACGGGETEKVYVPDLEQGGTITPTMNLNANFDIGLMSLSIPVAAIEINFIFRTFVTK